MKLNQADEITYKLRLMLQPIQRHDYIFGYHGLVGISPASLKFITPEITENYFKAYSKILKLNKLHNPYVVISGGEPGFHPKLSTLLDTFKKNDSQSTVEITTGGLLFHHDDFHLVEKKVDMIKVNITEGQLAPFNKMTSKNVMVQSVYSDTTSEKRLRNLIDYYTSSGVKVKVIFNLYSSKCSHKKYDDFAESYNLHKDNDRVVFGKSTYEHNSKLCHNCKTLCVSPTSLWVFPDGTASHCPLAKTRLYASHKLYSACKNNIPFLMPSNLYPTQNQIASCPS